VNEVRAHHFAPRDRSGDYLLPYRQTGADNDWRWGEQWLPHAAWYLLAASTGGATSR
jgi:hypothetical protein